MVATESALNERHCCSQAEARVRDVATKRARRAIISKYELDPIDSQDQVEKAVLYTQSRNKATSGDIREIAGGEAAKSHEQSLL